MASITHIEVATSEGMRAGYRAYQRKLRASGLPAVQDTASKFVGNKGFKLYCAKFGADVDAAKGIAQAPARRRLLPSRSSRPITPVVSERELLIARLAELDAAEAPVVPAKPARASKPTTVKENLWRAWAVRKYGIPTKVGGTFVYHSKKSGKSSTHKVVRVTADGCYTVKVS